MTSGTGLLVGSLLLAAMALPLAFGWVRPNPWYGLKPAACPTDAEAWMRLNRVAGRIYLAVAAAGLVLVKVAAHLQQERPVSLFAVLLLGAGAIIWVRARLERPGV